MSPKRERAVTENIETNAEKNLADDFISQPEKALLEEPEIAMETKKKINQTLARVASGEDRNYDLLCDHIRRADQLSDQELSHATQLCYWKKCRLKGESLSKFYLASRERSDDNIDFSDELLIEATRELILPFVIAGLNQSNANDFRRIFSPRPNRELLRTVTGLSADLINDRDYSENLKGLLNYLKRRDPRNLAVSVAYHIVDELSHEHPSASVLNYLVDTFTFLFHNGGSFIEMVDGGSVKPALVIGGKWTPDTDDDPHVTEALLLAMMDPEDRMRAINGLGISRSALSRYENLTDDDIIAVAVPGLISMPGIIGLDKEVSNKMTRHNSGFSEEQKQSLAYHLKRVARTERRPVVVDPWRYIDAGEAFDEEVAEIREEYAISNPVQRHSRNYSRTYYAEATKISRLMEDINYFDFEVAHEFNSIDFEDLNSGSAVAVRQLYQDISEMEDMPYQKFIDWHDKEGRDLVKIGKLLRLSGQKRFRIGESPVVLISYSTEKGEEVDAVYTTLIGEPFGYFYVNGSQINDPELIRRYLDLPKVVTNYLREGE